MRRREPVVKIAAQALSNSLTGFEFASGIPGTLGGAVMDERRGVWRRDEACTGSADVLTPEGEFLTLSLEELELGYRTSVVATKGIQFWAQRSHSKKAILRKSKRIWMT